MVTIDLNAQHKWEELFRRVEGGEMLRVVRGEKEIAIIQPAEVVEDDEAYLDFLAKLGAKQIAEAFPPNEFADWKQPDGTR